jgi:defect-in-organelle-trafficking protein DotB
MNASSADISLLDRFEGMGILSLDSLGEFLRSLKEKGGTDLLLDTGSRAFARIEGAWLTVSKSVLKGDPLSELLNEISGNASASSIVMSGKDLDFSFETIGYKGDKLRFRGNASAIASGWGTGISLSIRLLPLYPPRLSELNLEKELEESLFPENGLVLITGTMGSGKSTLLSSIFRKMVEDGGRHLVSYESPIEFDLTNLPLGKSPIEQSEVPRHIKSFAYALRNLARRSSDVVLVGESRDRETIRGVLKASEMGLSVYTTLHTRTVPETPGRILNMFSQKERESVKAALFGSLKVIVRQRLYPKSRGQEGRIAVREYLILDQEAGTILTNTPIKKINKRMTELLHEKGLSMEQALERETMAGRIDPERLASLLRERGQAPKKRKKNPHDN